MILELHPAALSEFGEHAEWYEARRDGLGVDFMAEIRGTLDRIAERPAVGTPWRRSPTVRRLALASFPFLVVYQSEENRVFVVAIAHTSRRPAYWHDRLRSSR